MPNDDYLRIENDRRIGDENRIREANARIRSAIHTHTYVPDFHGVNTYYDEAAERIRLDRKLDALSDSQFWNVADAVRGPDQSYVDKIKIVDEIRAADEANEQLITAQTQREYLDSINRSSEYTRISSIADANQREYVDNEMRTSAYNSEIILKQSNDDNMRVAADRAESMQTEYINNQLREYGLRTSDPIFRPDDSQNVQTGRQWEDDRILRDQDDQKIAYGEIVRRTDENNREIDRLTSLRLEMDDISRRIHEVDSPVQANHEDVRIRQEENDRRIETGRVQREEQVQRLEREQLEGERIRQVENDRRIETDRVQREEQVQRLEREQLESERIRQMENDRRIETERVQREEQIQRLEREQLESERIRRVEEDRRIDDERIRTEAEIQRLERERLETERLNQVEETRRIDDELRRREKEIQRIDRERMDVERMRRVEDDRRIDADRFRREEVIQKLEGERLDNERIRRAEDDRRLYDDMLRKEQEIQRLQLERYETERLRNELDSRRINDEILFKEKEYQRLQEQRIAIDRIRYEDERWRTQPERFGEEDESKRLAREAEEQQRINRIKAIADSGGNGDSPPNQPDGGPPDYPELNIDQYAEAMGAIYTKVELSVINERGNYKEIRVKKEDVSDVSKFAFTGARQAILAGKLLGHQWSLEPPQFRMPSRANDELLHEIPEMQNEVNEILIGLRNAYDQIPINKINDYREEIERIVERTVDQPEAIRNRDVGEVFKKFRKVFYGKVYKNDNLRMKLEGAGIYFDWKTNRPSAPYMLFRNAASNEYRKVVLNIDHIVELARDSSRVVTFNNFRLVTAKENQYPIKEINKIQW